MEERIRLYALAQGADMIGFASANDFFDAPEGFRPQDILPQAKGVIVMARALSFGTVALNNQVVYTAHHSSNLKQLDVLARTVALFIEEAGGIATPIPADDPYFHWDDERKHGAGILSHRHAATKAGLGMIGKNALLITPRYGNRVELVSVLTDVPFCTPTALNDLCPPGCRLCLDVCPAGALAGNYSVEQMQCRSNLSMKSARGHSLVKCWQCRSVCPQGIIRQPNK